MGKWIDGLLFSEVKSFEQGLREDWQEWNANAHPEDQMSFIDYVECLDTYNGVKVRVERDGWDCKILFGN